MPPKHRPSHNKHGATYFGPGKEKPNQPRGGNKKMHTRKANEKYNFLGIENCKGTQGLGPSQLSPAGGHICE